MIKQNINLHNKWLVIVYYNVDYNQFDFIRQQFLGISSPVEEIDNIYETMVTRRAKAVTCTSREHHVSIVLFNKHASVNDYVSSIVHEAKHVIDDIMKEYHIKNYGEPPAYAIGYLVKRMYSCFSKYLL